ncbi:membrane protein FxsA [Desulfonema ishimotonii]|uniref:Membrane protein FxsA n=1 Tax=Desulfonema ishimotonii TaxID=45657 RepID=A0A401G3L9_9BACT|nr:FxsA family protein [Desulfonema ishimotonii]GBC63814.1 membrane protein FxsA [Desulfonema ishimotonii]
MLFKLFLAFTLIPAMEIFLFIRIGQVIGIFNTFLIVILSGFAGAYLARMQGLQTLMRVRTSLEQGHVPAEELVDALIILVAGVVLLTPGFFTDTLGLLLLFPPSRFHFKRYLRYKFDQWVRQGNIRFTHFS